MGIRTTKHTQTTRIRLCVSSWPIQLIKSNFSAVSFFLSFRILTAVCCCCCCCYIIFDFAIIIQQSLSALTATYHQLNVWKEETRIKQNSEQTLNIATTKLFKAVSRLLEEENCCCDCDNDGNEEYPPSSTPSTSPSTTPSKKLQAQALL